MNGPSICRAPRAAIFALAAAVLGLPPVAAATTAEPTAETVRAPHQTRDVTAPSVDHSYGQLPLAFMRDGDSYTARTTSGSIALRRGTATITPSRGERAGVPVTIGLAGAAVVIPRVQQRLPGVVNDLRGDDPSEWRTDIPTFGRIRYAGVYPGIDLDFHGTSGTLEYDLRLAPGADPDRISVDFHGAPLRLTRAGTLVVGRGADRLRQAAPVAFQPSAEGHDPVPARFVLHGGYVSFELGAYDRARPLVIDPLVLSYATLLGGSAEDRINDVAVDSTGAAYLAGYTVSDTFPTTGGTYDATRAGIDAFVTKLNPAGSALVYSTLLGGSGTDFADTVAVDSTGRAVIAGETESNISTASERFPTTGGAYVTNSDSGSGDVFVTKLNAAGNGLEFSSAFGGTYREEAEAIALDAAGAVYVGGYTQSTGGNTPAVFPTSSGAYQPSPGGTSDDGFVAKLDTNGGRVYATFLGGIGQDAVNGIDIDSLGRAYVTGFAGGNFLGNGFPTTPGNRFADVDQNGTDAFLSRLSANGSALDYSTGIGADGGSGNEGSDYGYAVAVGATDGIAYIAGASRSPSASLADFPLKHAYQGRPTGCCFAVDAFAAKFDTSAAGADSLLYSTLIGGNGEESIRAMDVDSAGNAFVGGTTYYESGTFYPTTPDELGGGTNRGRAFVTMLVQSGSANATLGFSTTIQGTNDNNSVGGLVYGETAAAVYVGGTTWGENPTTAGAYQTTPQGDRDGFTAKITVSNDSTPPDTAITGGPTNGATVASNPVAFMFSAGETSTFECAYDGASFSPCSAPGPGTTGTDSRTLTEGPHTFSVRARDAAGNVDATPDSRSFTVTLADTTPPDTSITGGPANGSTVTSASVTFGFSSTEGASTFECSIDGDAFAACTTPGPGITGSDTRALPNGPHTFAVRARDAASNVDASPATRSFTVSVASPQPPDGTPPDTTITKPPPRTVKVKRSATVTVEFTSTELGSTFTCRIDGGPAQSCSSPMTFRLGKGKHTISIAALDASGNTDPSPATVQVTVKKKKPKKGGHH